MAGPDVIAPHFGPKPVATCNAPNKTGSHQMDCMDTKSMLVAVAPTLPPIRRPRGRPAGSKNKPKPPIIITRDSPSALRAHALEVSPGCDISDCIAGFARRRQRGVCVLGGSGCVLNVTIRQPGPALGATVTLHGRFEILSLLGTFFPPPAAAAVGGLTIFLGGSQGQVVGGGVVGPLVAASPVVITTATFMNAAFDRLPPDEDEESTMHNHLQKHVGMPNLYGIGLAASRMVAGGGLPPELYAWAQGQQLGELKSNK